MKLEDSISTQLEVLLGQYQNRALSLAKQEVKYRAVSIKELIQAPREEKKTEAEETRQL